LKASEGGGGGGAAGRRAVGVGEGGRGGVEERRLPRPRAPDLRGNPPRRGSRRGALPTAEGVPGAHGTGHRLRGGKAMGHPRQRMDRGNRPVPWEHRGGGGSGQAEGARGQFLRTRPTKHPQRPESPAGCGGERGYGPGRCGGPPAGGPPRRTGPAPCPPSAPAGPGGTGGQCPGVRDRHTSPPPLNDRLDERADAPSGMHCAGGSITLPPPATTDQPGNREIGIVPRRYQNR